MRDLKKFSKNCDFDFDKLLEYGFIKEGKLYTYQKYIMNKHFLVVVKMNDDFFTSLVLDTNTMDEYILVDVDCEGEYVGRVNDAYESILNDIIDKCGKKDIFKCPQAKAVIKYINDTYNDTLEYLWEKFPDNAIWRNIHNNKWYGVILNLSKEKLGIADESLVTVLNLRYPKDKIKSVIDNNMIFPGYHMNKNNWISIILDGRMSMDVITKLIDDSYQISLKK